MELILNVDNSNPGRMDVTSFDSDVQDLIDVILTKSSLNVVVNYASGSTSQTTIGLKSDEAGFYLEVINS